MWPGCRESFKDILTGILGIEYGRGKLFVDFYSKKILAKLFLGSEYGLGRVNIGGCDFSDRPYTYCDTEVS